MIELAAFVYAAGTDVKLGTLGPVSLTFNQNLNGYVVTTKGCATATADGSAFLRGLFDAVAAKSDAARQAAAWEVRAYVRTPNELTPPADGSLPAVKNPPVRVINTLTIMLGPCRSDCPPTGCVVAPPAASYPCEPAQPLGLMGSPIGPPVPATGSIGLSRSTGMAAPAPATPGVVLDDFSTPGSPGPAFGGSPLPAEVFPLTEPSAPAAPPLAPLPEEVVPPGDPGLDVIGRASVFDPPPAAPPASASATVVTVPSAGGPSTLVIERVAPSVAPQDESKRRPRHRPIFGRSRHR